MKAALFFSLFTIYGGLNAQEKVRPVWVDSLRAYLTLDEPLASDSTLTVQCQNHTVQLYINRTRPSVLQAIELLDSLLAYDFNDTTAARLETILVEFDARYMYEFGFASDYFYNIYHRCSFDLTSDTSEFTIIEYLEYAVKILKLRRSNPMRFVEILIGKDSTYFNNENFISSSYRIFGRVNQSHLTRYYRRNTQLYEDYIAQIVSERITRAQAYRVLHVLGLYDKTPPEPADCTSMIKFINTGSSPEFLSVVTEFTDRWDNQNCLQALLSDLRK